MGADPNCQNDHGEGVLHVACMRGGFDVVNYLLTATAADVNLKNM